jgi:hypothetical protein
VDYIVQKINRDQQGAGYGAIDASLWVLVAFFQLRCALLKRSFNDCLFEIFVACRKHFLARSGVQSDDFLLKIVRDIIDAKFRTKTSKVICCKYVAVARRLHEVFVADAVIHLDKVAYFVLGRAVHNVSGLVAGENV